MTEILETSRPLTLDERQKLKAYAESLIAQRAADATKDTLTYLDVDSFAGMFAGLAPEKTDVELAHEANDIIRAKYDKYFK